MLMVGLGAGSMVVLFTLPVVLNGFGRMCGEIWILAAAIILREPGTQFGSSWWPGRGHWEITHELSIQFLLLKNFFCLSWPESSCCFQPKVPIMFPAFWMSWVAERSRCDLERKVKELWALISTLLEFCVFIEIFAAEKLTLTEWTQPCC